MARRVRPEESLFGARDRLAYDVTRMQAFVLEEGDKIVRVEQKAAIDEAHKRGKRVWVDLDERTTESDQLLADTFQIHPLVCEDIWLDRSVPKLDRFDEYIYIIVHGVRRASDSEKVGLWVLDIVVGPNFVITQHRDRPTAAAARELDRLPALLTKGTFWVAHALIDRVVDQYLPFIDEIGQRIEKLEREVFEKAGTPDDDRLLLPKLFTLRRSMQELCRITPHQLETLARLARPDFKEIPSGAIPYFRDVNDHFVRVAQLTESFRDVVTNTMDAYLSLQSNRMNDTMKRLAMISTLMLPLTFIAGLYGMNFRFMPELSWRYGYPFALGAMATIAAVILLWFKKKRWL
jgi:magnesium transporter